MERPEFLTDEHLEYLDELRESGDTNMYGATPYLRAEFFMDREEANAVLAYCVVVYWMRTFSERHN